MAREVVSAGGVVFRRVHGRVELLLMLDRFGRWTLPKGHLEAGEGPEEAALREIREETGIDGRVVAVLPATAYYLRDQQGPVQKKVHYYLVEAVGGEAVPQPGEVEAVRWFAPGEIGGLRQYENNREIIQGALARLGAA